MINALVAFQKNHFFGHFANFFDFTLPPRMLSYFSIRFGKEKAYKEMCKAMDKTNPDIVFSTHWVSNYVARTKKGKRPYTIMFCPDCTLDRLFTYPSDLRYGVSAIYKVDGIVVDEDKFAVKDIGEHFVSITLKDSYYKKLADRTTTAKVNVNNSNFVGIDSSKTAFTIDNNTKYKELRSEILKGNFTLNVEEEEEIIRSSIEDYFCDDSVTREEAQEELREIVEGFWSEVGESFSNID